MLCLVSLCSRQTRDLPNADPAMLLEIRQSMQMDGLTQRALNAFGVSDE